MIKGFHVELMNMNDAATLAPLLAAVVYCKKIARLDMLVG